MNWKRLYALLQICFMVGLAAAFSAGFWSFVVAGICRIAFALGESESMLLIGLPLFVALFFVFAKYLPKPLRKAGMLSEDPSAFGPWFKG
ncbi:hypothetical protein [Cupriavidus nantongensis]|uniref:Uncharacterized protein n=1 Tax=Cupriavidus nantongensis TaxID=1796606 RepID=A0A142JRS5_9BURK|nr:hypothetical protein [Cupriavidus nantongensis]AMR80787.1 hypothetical protein A2G96_23435 [Cupriavidus nantongensis]